MTKQTSTPEQTLRQQLSAAQAQLEELKQRNLQLQSILDHQDQNSLDVRNDRRDLYFARVLGSGHYHTTEELFSGGRYFDIEFPNPCFAVILCRPEEIQTGLPLNMDRGTVNFILRNTFENCFDVPCYAADVKDQIVAIINLEHCSEFPVSMLDNLRGALRTLEQEYNLNLTATVSRVYESPLELNRAMTDAENVQEYLDVMGIYQRITSYEALTHHHMTQSESSWLDFQTQLLGCARTSDVAGVRRLMHELICSELYSNPPTVDIFKFRMYGIVNTMLYLMEDMRAAIGQEFLDEVNVGYRLTHAETMEELMYTMDDILIQLEQFVVGTQTAVAPAWGEQIRDYVMEHFRDPDLTVASLADSFSITPTYCSRMFKQATNQRLFDFIQLQRLSAAQELLPGSMSLTEIAELCGFSSALTMSRAFKRYEGAAPSALRNTLKPESSTE